MPDCDAVTAVVHAMKEEKGCTLPIKAEIQETFPADHRK